MIQFLALEASEANKKGVRALNLSCRIIVSGAS